MITLRCLLLRRVLRPHPFPLRHFSSAYRPPEPLFDPLKALANKPGSVRESPPTSPRKPLSFSKSPQTAPPSKGSLSERIEYLRRSLAPPPPSATQGNESAASPNNSSTKSSAVPRVSLFKLNDGLNPEPGQNNVCRDFNWKNEGKDDLMRTSPFSILTQEQKEKLDNTRELERLKRESLREKIDKMWKMEEEKMRKKTNMARAKEEVVKIPRSKEENEIPALDPAESGPDQEASEIVVKKEVDKGKRVAKNLLVKDPSNKIKSSKSKTSGKEKGKKSCARCAANDHFTLELPKNFVEMDRKDSLAFVSALHTSDDSVTFNQTQPGPIEEIISQQFVQFSSSLGRIVQSLSQSSKEEELSEANKRIEELTRALSDQKKEEEELKKRAFDDGVRHGIDLYRRRFFRTSAGQNFLKSLHEGLIFGFSVYVLRSFANQFRSPGDIEGTIFANQFRSSEDIEGSISAKGIVTFEGYNSRPCNHPWWLPVMNDAVQHLIKDGIVDPELLPAEEIFYDLDLPNSSADPTKVEG